MTDFRSKPFILLASFAGAVVLILLVSFVFPNDYVYNLHFLTGSLLKKNGIYIAVAGPRKKPVVKKETEKPQNAPLVKYNPQKMIGRKKVSRLLTIFSNCQHSGPGIASHSLPDGQFQGLNEFYRKLSQILLYNKKRTIKVAIFGDSIIGGDLMPGFLRRDLQHVFGYGGPGFVCLDYPFKYYVPQDMDLYTSDNWNIIKITRKERSDTLLGISGYSFYPALVESSFSVYSRKNDWVYYDLAELYYLAYSNGGGVCLSAAGGMHHVVDTFATNVAVKKYTIRLNPSNELFISNLPGRTTRVYGVEFSSSRGGLILNTYPQLGGSIGISLLTDKDNWVENLALMEPDLVIFMYGMNIFKFGTLPQKMYRRQLNSIIERVKTAQPSASIMFVGPLEKPVMEGGELRSLPIMHEIIEAQKSVSLENGGAFFDVFAAIGGENALEEWYGAEGVEKYVCDDLIHLTKKGARKMARLIFDALMLDYRDHLVYHKILLKEHAAPHN